MLMNRISRCISATKSITRHAFVEFIKTVLFVIETWLFNGSDGGCSGAIIRCIKRDIVLNFLSPKSIPKNVIKKLKTRIFPDYAEKCSFNGTFKAEVACYEEHRTEV